MGQRKIIFVAALWLAGCASPSVLYRGIVPETVMVSGLSFDVYSNGQTAQAIRVSRGKPDVAVFRVAAIQAIEIASGCSVVRDSVDGDFNLVDATLKC